MSTTTSEGGEKPSVDNTLEKENKASDAIPAGRARAKSLSTIISGKTKNTKNRVNYQIWKSYFWVIAFTTVNLIATFVNHIDDTDEVYGYWEPLHYLLFNQGMQTWEYDPQYAIRSYAFIFPFYGILKGYQKFIGAVIPTGLPINTIPMFYIVRLWLSLLTGLAQASFVMAVDEHVFHNFHNKYIGVWTGLFLITSPGVFFASTSYLPSAISMSLYMLTIASWLRSRYLTAIAWGVLAVVWTGWPFVGVLFLPIGFHMLYSIARKNGLQFNKEHFLSSFFKSLPSVLFFVLKAILVLVLTGAPALLIDFYYYNKTTIPALNIFLYNAFGGSAGDELYGVEPVSYYIKNLLLNTGVAWPLTIFSLQILLLRYLTGSHLKIKTFHPHISEHLWVLHAAAFIWMLILFVRPHKEERFMYPVYPLIAMIAATAFDTISHLPLLLITSNSELMRERSNSFTGEPTPVKESTPGKETTLPNEEQAKETKTTENSRNESKETPQQKKPPLTKKESKSEDESSKKITKSPMTRSNSGSADPATVAAANSSIVGTVRFIVFALVITTAQLSFMLFLSRVTANYSNYQGYIDLWKQVYPRLEEQLTTSTSHAVDHEPVEITICIGREWYRFPSHFFLPKFDNISRVSLEYIEDDFKGILPQHFPRHPHGTSQPPVQPMNNMNREEISRYVTIDTCDYLITKNHDLQEILTKHHLCLAEEMEMLNSIDRECSFWKSNIALTDSVRVLSSQNTGPSWLRAYYVPILTEKHMKKTTYGMFALYN